jgi:hypothetical protein
VLYAYQDFPDGVDRDAERKKILEETIAAGFKYVSDIDSRSAATAHPDGNLWDNGADAVAELEHLLRVREIALRNFSERNIRVGRPLARIEEVLVPIFLLHRYQIEAVGKLIGGQYFNYSLRGDGQPAPTSVSVERQKQAIDALIATLDPAMLKLPDELVALIPPRPPNDPKSRETFRGANGIIFDPKSPAGSAVAMTLNVLLEPTRAARLASAGAPGLEAVTSSLLDATWKKKSSGGITGGIERQTERQVMYALLRLAFSPAADGEVRGIALAALDELDTWLSRQSPKESLLKAHYNFARSEMERLRRDPSQLEQLAPVVIPPGSPIGSYSNQY